MYTMTPTEDFILDFLPGSGERVAIAAGFSGHGFKLAPLVGRIMAELATKGARGGRGRRRRGARGLCCATSALREKGGESLTALLRGAASQAR